MEDMNHTFRHLMERLASTMMLRLIQKVQCMYTLALDL